PIRRGPQTESLKSFENAGLGLRNLPSLDLPEAVEKYVQRPGRGNTRIQLTKRSRRGVAGVDEGSFSLLRGTPVHFFECVLGDEHLPSHFEHRWQFPAAEA